MRSLSFSLLLLFGYTITSSQEDWTMVRAATLRELASTVSASGGVMGVAVIDLASGDSFGVNDTLVFPQGSAIKIAVLMEVFRQDHEGTLHLTDKLPVAKSVQTGGSGTLQYFGDRTSDVSIRDLCVMMIVLSDNTATNMLIDRVGMEKVNAMLRSLGLQSTLLQRRMITPQSSARGQENLSTPREAARLMQILYQGTFVNKAVCGQILDILALPKQAPVRAGVPDSVKVAFKPGGIAGVITEWDLVLLPERPYVVTVMEKFGEAAGTEERMTKLSTAVFAYFWRLGRTTKYGTYVDPSMLK